MTQGREVVEDYRSTGLSLRAHPSRSFAKRLDAGGYRHAAPCETAAEWSPALHCGARARAANAGLGQGRHVRHTRR